MKLGEAMVKEGLITREQLRLALERQVVYGGRIGTNIVELGIIREPELLAFLSKFFNVPAVNPVQMSAIDSETISSITGEIAEKYKMVPFRKERNRLYVAMMDPKSLASIDEVRFVTGYDIVPHAITELRLLYALEKYYGIQRNLRYISIFGKDEEDTRDIDINKEHLKKVKEAFANAQDRDEIIGLLLNEAQKTAKRAAIFILKGDRLTGWKARGIDVEGLDIPVGLGAESALNDVVNKKNYYRGPLLNIPGNQMLISRLSGTPQDCCIIPIQIRDRTIAILYVDNGNNAVLNAGLVHINNLVNMASISFEIAILRKKIMEL